MESIQRAAHARREVFERLAGDFWERAAAPLRTLLARNDVSVADLAAVELLGGGSRIPRVQAALSAALGGRALDRCARNAPGFHQFFLLAYDSKGREAHAHAVGVERRVLRGC